ncbi:SUMF1/EgtB/PvdO family nonheme iron enzyme [Sorangium sp. So ce216]
MWAAAAVACGGCAQIIGADWDDYTLAEGVGGTGGLGANSGTGGTPGTGSGVGGAECSDDEIQCSDNTPQRCGDGRWQSGKVCAGQTCVGGTCTGQCGPGDVRCLDNRPQRCDERGQWENENECPTSRPFCNGGTCTGLSCIGLPATCGPVGKESCCTSAPVAGGRFDRDNDPDHPATVDGLLLDRFEVTVGRFRKFMAAYPGNKPTAGAGEHPSIAGSGWDAGWDSHLPADSAALMASVKCRAHHSWTDEAGEHENLPINCLNWYVAFAFCVWDGGRLPTEAEWNYAAAGGDEQRVFPWGTDVEQLDSTFSVFNCTGDDSEPGLCALSDIQPVGSRSPKGDGRWGQADLAGSMWEWALDWHAVYPPGTCDNRATLGEDATQPRVARGGSWFDDESYQGTSLHHSASSGSRFHHVGVRCARAY